MLIARFSSYLRHELNRSKLTVEAYERDLRQFSGWITCYNPDMFQPRDVTLSDVRAWLASLARQGVTPRSLRRKTQSLRAFFKFLLKTKEISSNPTKDLILPKLPKPLPDNIPADEIEKILSMEETVIENESSSLDQTTLEAETRDHLIIELLYSLGIRRAELIAITDADISPSASEIKITGKRSKQRVVPVPEKLMLHIIRWQKMRDSIWRLAESPRPLFVVKGKRITPWQVYNIVRKALSGVAAKKKSPHALRHSFATTMINEGADLDTVKEFLGHASLATTQIYTHISFKDMKHAYDAAHPRTRNPRDEKNNP